VIDGVLEGGNVRGNRESCFVAGDVEGGDAGACKLLDEMGGLKALLGVEVTEGAEDEPSFDASGTDALLGGTIDGGNDGFRGESLIRVQERGEAEFGVDDVVGSELLKDVFGDEAESVFSLHELEAAWGAGKEVGEARALGRGDEFGVVLGTGDFRSEARDGGIAEGAVEMEVKFDFGEIGHGCETIYLAI
jgi:hypothetical protein